MLLKDKKNNMIDKNLSQAISYLRLPLALLIIFGHSDILSFPIYSHGEIAMFEQSSICIPVSFFSLVLFGSAVPLFFMISGYLFFIKNDDYNASQYKSKIKKRLTTLLVPYLIWNLLYVLFNIIVEVLKGGEIDFSSQIFSLWSMPTQPYPADPALWFVRDLMVCMILSPIIYYLTKRYFLFSPFIIIFLSLWLTNSFSDKIIPGISISSCLFFSVGAFVGIKKKDVSTILKTTGGGIFLVWASVSLLVLLFKEYPSYSTGHIEESTQIIVIYRMANLLGCLTYLYIALYISQRWNIQSGKKDHSFIIFSLHMLILMILRKIVDVSIPSEISQGVALGIYVMYVVISFVISLFASILIHKNNLATRLFAGGR